MLPGNISNLARVRFPPSGTAPGNVDGPSSSTDNALVRFDGTTGKIIQNGVVTENDLTGTLTGPASQTTTTAVGIGYTNQPLNDGVEILSNSASDVQSATVIGTTTGGNVVVVETVTLNGTTFVPTVKTNWGQILAIKLSSAAIGTITVRKATGDATITTLAPAATASGVTTVVNTAAYNRAVVVVADGATTKQFGFGGTNSAGTQIYDSVALTGTTPIASNSAFNTLTEMYRGDLEVARTVTETSNSTFSLVGGTTGQLDINSLGVSLPSTQTNGLQIYNTVDQVTNYERLDVLWSSSIARIRTIAGGSGTVRDMVISRGNATSSITLQGNGSTAGVFIFAAGSSANPTKIGSSFTNTDTATSGVNTAVSILPTYNQASGNAANTDLLINRIITASGSGNQSFADFQVNGTSWYWFGLGNQASTGSFNSSSAVELAARLQPTFASQTGTAGWTVLTLNAVAAGSGSGAKSLIDAQVGGASKFTLLNTGIQSVYAGVACAGWGSPAIYGSGSIAATTNARSAAVATYTVGAADGTFVVSGNVNVTTSTTHSFSLDCVYTDETNASRTLVIPVAQLAGSFVATGLITNVTGAGPYESASMTIRCKASTSITIRPSAGGTYTGVVYNTAASITQIA